MESNTPRYPLLADGEWLRKRYIDDRASIPVLARQIGCEQGAVRQALARHDIPVRPGARRPILADMPADEAMALVREHGLRGAARQLDVNVMTFLARLGNLGISREAREYARAHAHDRARPAILRSKAALAALYRGHTASEIAAMHGCALPTVTKALREHGIPVRPSNTPPPERPLPQRPGLVAQPGERKCLNPACAHRVIERGLCRRCMSKYKRGGLPGVTPLPRWETRRDPDRRRCNEPGCSRYVRRNDRCDKHPLPRPTRKAKRGGPFRQANDGRRVAAAAETVEAACRALVDCSPEHRDVLAARIEHPSAPLAELASILGLSKDAYAARLRRALNGYRQPQSVGA